jgi:uncharacterized protein YhaN
MGRVAELHSQTAEAKKEADEALAAEKAAADVVDSASTLRDKAIAQCARRHQTAGAAAAALQSAGHELAARQSAWNESVAEVASGWSRRFALASLKPLTPEQLCWTLLRITGVYDRHKAVEIAELEKSATLTDEQKRDSAALAARSAEIEQRTFDKLKGNLATFIQLYGSGAGQPQGDFYASADQALFAANASAINGWIAPAGGNITERIVQASDPRVAAEELYLAVLSRLPTEQESDEVTAHLASRSPDTSVAAVELVWGLINSAEFRFNH